MSEADGPKQVREGCTSGAPEEDNSGAWPTRKRGYYRALKRKEAWAERLSKMDPFQWIFTWTYRPYMLRQLVYCENPLLKLISKDKSFEGKFFPVPIIYGKPNE